MKNIQTMIKFWRILPVIYFYFYIHRITDLVFKEKYSAARKLISALAAVLIVVKAGSIWELGAMILLHLSVIGLAVDLAVLPLKHRWKKKPVCWEKIYKSGVIPVLLTALVLGYGYLNAHQVIETEYTVYTEKALQPGGYDIVFLSDLHFGTTMEEEQLEQICQKIELETPDLVILGGDIVDERSTLRQMQNAFQILGGIDSRFGIYYIYGNHDKGIYSEDCAYTAEQLSTAIQEAQIRILEDESCVLDSCLTLTGRRDRTEASRQNETRKSSKALLADMSENCYHILVDHQPVQMERNENAGADLMLSGHTHAGQIWPVGLSTELFNDNTINYGHEIWGSLDVIVSSGIGGGAYPVRTGRHCEYVMVHIREIEEKSA